FPSTNFNARHGTAVFTCVGGPTPRGFSNKHSNTVRMDWKCGHAAHACKSLRMDRLIELHHATIALQQKLRAQRIVI
ncbi:hypothetical protein, partial [Tardiphaga sp.]|uniref:hypothetical protein n=1 Tax=Tardiphaga sp. TaxID=1926292 RepID=UPI0037DA6536